MSFNRRWDLVQVYMAYEERNRRYSGMSVEQVAQEQGKGIMDAFLDLVLDDDLRTSFQVIDREQRPQLPAGYPGIALHGDRDYRRRRTSRQG